VVVSAREFGALVISLDFELHWGVRDHAPATGAYRPNLLGVWSVVPRMLELFEEFGIAATWATVGFLFARSRQDREWLAPSTRPRYADPRLSPYDEPVGDGEADDPLHYAPSLIERIRATPRQEIGTHTFSHYYCLESGQDRETFRADLESAVRAARRDGIELRSIVFPRNQHNPAYDDLLKDAGIVCYRGNPRGWMYRVATRAEQRPAVRAARLLDAYVAVAGPHLTAWADVRRPSGLCDVPGSFFLRPYSPRLRELDGIRVRRIVRSMELAARTRRIVHVWWHPHNFGRHPDESVAILRRLLEAFAHCRERYDMRSLAMGEVARIATGAGSGVRAAGAA
jgi:peptidoglycan/xylan/chitin deacetylase (PgdA/CDA1 family)